MFTWITLFRLEPEVNWLSVVFGTISMLNFNLSLLKPL